MVREKRSQKILKQISNDLYYEFYMFDKCARGLNQGLAGTNRISNNALLESFGIKGRILFHFFYPPKKLLPNDVVAIDFFDNFTDWESEKPEVDTRFIKEFCDSVSKRIVHLSYDRTEVSTEDQNWGSIGKQTYQHISEAFHVFLKLVPTENLEGELLKEKMNH